MAKDLETLRKQLETSKAARAKFLADTLQLFKQNGVDVDDDAVVDQLALNLDLNNGAAFVEGLSASTVAVTITK